MKRNKKEYFILIIILSILILGVPVIFNTLYKIHSNINFFVAEWSCGELLTYYGSILGALLAVVGVYFTIKDSKKARDAEFHNNVLPFIAVNFFRSKAKFNIFNLSEAKGLNKDDKISEVGSNDISYKEYKLNKIYYILEDGKISVKTSLTERQQKMISQYGYNWENDVPGKFSLKSVNLVSIPLELDNVGNGPAINLRIGINKTDNVEPKYIIPVNLKVNQTLYLHIYAENETKDNIGNYLLEVYYCDIYQKQYRQVFKFSILEMNNKIYGEFNYDSKQEAV